MNLKFKTGFFFYKKDFQDKEIHVFPSKTAIYQLQATTTNVDIFIHIVIEHFKLKPYTAAGSSSDTQGLHLHSKIRLENEVQVETHI
jgi:hypothetical protein